MKTYKGLVGLSRVNGSKKLYMSNLNNSNWISLRVYEGRDTTEYGEKKVFAKSGRPLVDLELSASQFAELLTTMNVGHGVPCTLRYINGEEIDQAGLEEDEKPVDIGKKHFEKNAKEFTEKINKKTSDYLEELEGLKMSKKDKARVQHILQDVKTEINSNMPFYVSMFEEAAKKVVTESKTEIDAFVQGGIVKAGLEALGIKGQDLIEEDNNIRSEDC